MSLQLFESKIATFIELRAGWRSAIGPVSVSDSVPGVNSTTASLEDWTDRIASFCESIQGVKTTAEHGYEDIAKRGILNCSSLRCRKRSPAVTNQRGWRTPPQKLRRVHFLYRGQQPDSNHDSSNFLAAVDKTPAPASGPLLSSPLLSSPPCPQIWSPKQGSLPLPAMYVLHPTMPAHTTYQAPTLTVAGCLWVCHPLPMFPILDEPCNYSWADTITAMLVTKWQPSSCSLWAVMLPL